jgi:hypothetical protein
MSQVLNVGDQIASVVSAVVGLITLILSWRARGVRPEPTDKRDGSGLASDSAAGAATLLGFPRERVAVQLGTIWLFAAVLTVYGQTADSYSAYFVGLVLMGTVVAVSSIAASAAGDRRLGFTVRITNPQGRKHLIAEATAMLPLVAAGYLLALAADHLDIPVAWIIPAFASVSFAGSAILGFVRERRGARTTALATRQVIARWAGALTIGSIVAAIVVFVAYGPESHWSTGRSLEGAYATGTIRRIAADQIQVTGSVVDAMPDTMSARLYIDPQTSHGPVTPVPYTASGGVGSSVDIDDRDPSTKGQIFSGDVTSIEVWVCLADSKSTHERVDTKCGAPLKIWQK